MDAGWFVFPLGYLVIFPGVHHYLNLPILGSDNNSHQSTCLRSLVISVFGGNSLVCLDPNSVNHNRADKILDVYFSKKINLDISFDSRNVKPYVIG